MCSELAFGRGSDAAGGSAGAGWGGGRSSGDAKKMKILFSHENYFAQVSGSNSSFVRVVKCGWSRDHPCSPRYTGWVVKVVKVVKTKTKERKMIFLLFDLFVTTLTTLTARGHSGREWGWSRFRALLAMGTARPTSKTTAYYSFGEICGISSKVDVSRGVPKDRARQKSIARQNRKVSAPRPPNESSSPHPLPHMNLPLFKNGRFRWGEGG